MARYAPANTLDGVLDRIAAGTRLLVLPSQPSSYAAADAAKLAQATLAPADFSKSGADGAPRVLTVAAKNGLTATASGTANHVAIVDVAASSLLFVTVCPAVAITSGGTVNVASFSITAQQPTA